LVALDFFVVPTAAFGVLFGLIVLAHHRRRVVHFNVTTHPTAEWTARQMIQAFPEEGLPGLARPRHESRRWLTRGADWRYPTREVRPALRAVGRGLE
jgi:hypothetical protein